VSKREGAKRFTARVIPDLSDRRPWLTRKPNETALEWNRRTNHTCYACGDYYKDLDELDIHEATHR
jgi:hypothetical protein